MLEYDLSEAVWICPQVMRRGEDTSGVGSLCHDYELGLRTINALHYKQVPGGMNITIRHHGSLDRP